MSYILGVDVWEGNPLIDEVILQDEGVQFMIVRLNSPSGGHHMDENFLTQWGQATNFIRWPYFVYSPWFTGQQNFDWLAAHMPADASAVSIDIELRKTGYTPHEYMTQVNIFCALVKQCWNFDIYTGLWFKDCLETWPADCEYWWARYPYALYPEQSQSLTWAELRAKMDGYGWHPGTTFGPCRLWQCTADRYYLPGCGGKKVDINQWKGTLEELQIWAGQTPHLSLEQRVTAAEERLYEVEDWISQHQP
jgi:GH25 family lysozyme M1 (1,4-beta-N-acetylmuramidase)